ncbi:MAG: hypothetical protein SF029_26025 [bacterium]|nr:hypothetical protein [bacterium]
MNPNTDTHIKRRTGLVAWLMHLRCVFGFHEVGEKIALDDDTESDDETMVAYCLYCERRVIFEDRTGQL